MAKRKHSDESVLGSASFSNAITKSTKQKTKSKNIENDISKLHESTSGFPDCSITADSSGNCKAFRDMLADDSLVSDFACDVITGIYDLVNDGKIDLYPARVGIATTTDAIIWDRRKLYDILTSNGYCSGCANLFIDSLEEPIDGLPQNILICSEIDLAYTKAEIAFIKRAKDRKK